MRKCLVTLSTLLLPTLALASNDLTIPTSVDTSPIFTAAGAVIAGIFGIWCIKKVIKLGNRS